MVVTETDGPAAEAGLRSGDVILGANRTAVNSIAQLREAVRQAGRSVALLVQSNRQQRIITIQTE